MNEHTPGPWRPVIRANQHKISLVAVDMAPHGRSWRAEGKELTEMDIGDAHLIAAAPELLEALEGLVNVMQGLIDGAEDIDLGNITLKPARAALAKARGVE